MFDLFRKKEIDNLYALKEMQEAKEDRQAAYDMMKKAIEVYSLAASINERTMRMKPKESEFIEMKNEIEILKLKNFELLAINELLKQNGNT